MLSLLLIGLISEKVRFLVSNSSLLEKEKQYKKRKRKEKE